MIRCSLFSLMFIVHYMRGYLFVLIYVRNLVYQGYVTAKFHVM